MQQFNYQSAQFITSAAQMSQCPIDEGAEVAFCGRSNAGKSSALKPFDEMMLEWSQIAGLPIHVLLTKADKLARGAQQNALLKVNATLPIHAKAQTFSAPNGQGLETLKTVLDGWLSIDS